MKKSTIICLGLAALLLSGCGQTGKLKAEPAVEKTFEEVSVHDPSIVDGGDGYYYIFGSHLAVAKTDDLMNWTYVNRGVKNENSVIPNVYSVMKDAFEWSHSNTFWAPDVIRLKSGKYCMYYCNCEGSTPLSCLGTAIADSVEGPYVNQGIMLRSGMGADELSEDGKLYQSPNDPNVVDPVVFYDQEGRLWMIYGSYSGGIFVKEMDPESGQPLEPGYGKKLLGGDHLRIEAPYVIYNKDTGYYYMFLSFGGLDSDGGYNIRVCRAKSPDGPYFDSMGQDMIDCKGPAGSVFSDASAALYGAKLMGCYKFLWAEGEDGEDREGYLSPGHNSCLYQEESGKYFMIHHTRFENRGEEHQVRVRQMFFNEDGWPVLAPHRYVGETIGSYTAQEIAGTYKFINHGREISPDIRESVQIELKKNGSVSGQTEGAWELKDGNRITLTVNGDAYKGVVLKQWDEEGRKYVFAFTALNAETGIAVWGSGLNALETIE